MRPGPVTNVSELEHPSNEPSRRRFLEATIWISGSGIAIALGLPGARFLATPLLRDRERTWVDLGEAAALRDSGQPVAVRFRFEAWNGYVRGDKPGLLWVVGDPDAADGLSVLSAVCPHKGCNVAWSAEEALFACPCHRGRFDDSGARVSGPPDRALQVVPSEVRDGHLFAELSEAWV